MIHYCLIYTDILTNFLNILYYYLETSLIELKMMSQNLQRPKPRASKAFYNAKRNIGTYYFDSAEHY